MVADDERDQRDWPGVLPCFGELAGCAIPGLACLVERHLVECRGCGRDDRQDDWCAVAVPLVVDCFDTTPAGVVCGVAA